MTAIPQSDPSARPGADEVDSEMFAEILKATREFVRTKVVPRETEAIYAAAIEEALVYMDAFHEGNGLRKVHSGIRSSPARIES